MWLLGFLLLPVVLATTSELTIDDYVIKIENNTLTSVQSTGRSIELNLSGLGLRQVKNGTFNDLTNLRILNLANNSLIDLPEFVFSNLTNLKHLSLVDNNIKHFANAFVGLGNLKSLNISKNPVKSFGPAEFYGLSSSVDIFTLGNNLENIRTNLFEKRPEPKSEHRISRKIKTNRPSDFPVSTFRAKACVQNGKLYLVDYLNDDEILGINCTEILLENDGRIFIENLEISSFERGWYRIESEKMWMISLTNNSVTRLTRELLNDLPKNIIFVSLEDNKIDRLERGVIENFHVRTLSFNGNSISEVENGTFQMTDKLEDLNFNDNCLKDIKFADSLPSSVTILSIERNQLTEIPDDSFLNVEGIEYLRLDGNHITVLRRNSLRGIRYMYNFGMSDNQMTIIEPGSFRDQRRLGVVSFRNNSLSNLERGIFDGPRIVESLDLGMNKFTNVTEQIRGNLPHELWKLILDFNEIGSLETGSFVNVPKKELYLRGSKISKIERGSLNLPTLKSLDLGNNSLGQIDGELFENFRYIDKIWLDGNDITKIEKGFAKHLIHVSQLNISRNPIRRLENGALFGIQKNDAERFIITSETPIELIQGGLFEDV